MRQKRVFGRLGLAVMAALMVFLSVSTASAAMYIRNRYGEGPVHRSQGDTGYFMAAEKGGGTIVFPDKTRYYIFDKKSSGAVFDEKGNAVDFYYMYTYNPETKSYEYKEGDVFHSVSGITVRK
jgi:hypothetical protein